MERLSGTNLQVVLSLKQGKGFDKVTNPTIVVATLNGLSLETDLISPESNPLFATDLVWEANKSTLRKMRSGHEPLKLEYYEFKENGLKDKIGYVLLSLRSAQIIPQGSNDDVKTNWHKLLGVRSDVKGDKPELLVSLTIEDKQLPECVPSKVHQKMGIAAHQRQQNESQVKCLRSTYSSDYTTAAAAAAATKMNHFSTFEIPRERSGNAITHSCIEKDCTKSVEAYHCYCLNITLNAVTLKTESIKNVEFRFHHPKAEVMSTLYPKMPIRMGETLRLYDIGCKLHLISSVEEIKHLLLRYPPKISIRNNEERIEKTCLGQTTLDVTRIFNEATLECNYEAPLHDCNHQEIGSLQIHMNLEDHGPYYSSTKISWSENLGPPILDDSLAYKIVDELETWKERQQEIFRVELKRKEERHLNLLSEEWQRRREALESQLACSIEQCKTLTTSLNKATDDLRIRRLQSMDKEAKLLKTNEELKWNYEKKLRELKDISDKIQEDYSSKLLKLEEENRNLQNQIASLKTENIKLQKIICQNNEELEKYKKQSLASDQTQNLLQEVKLLEKKLDETVKSKRFFKEEWGKAVREIHKLKLEHQQALQVQIKSSREELKHIDLEQLLKADSAALKNDKMLLDEIQREINVIKPKPSYTNIEDSVLNSAYDSCCRSNAEFSRPYSGKSSEEDERLRKLIEERDTLLKTGSYSIDDLIIIQLNSEIRSLLMT